MRSTVSAPLRIKSLSYLSLRTVSPRLRGKKTILPDGLFCRKIIGMEREYPLGHERENRILALLEKIG